MMALYYPGGGWVRLQTSTLDRLQERKAEAGLPSFDACVAELLEADARRARRHAALRGLRALPVHAGRDQERDADAVRDRLPAGLRGRQRRDVRPPADRVRRSAATSVRGRGPLPPGQRRAPPGRGPPRRPPSISSGRQRRRLRVRLPPRPRVDRLRRRAHDDPRGEPHRGPLRPRPGRGAAALASSPPTSSAASRAGASSRRWRPTAARTSTRGRCSPRRRTTPCSAPRSCSPTTRRSRRRARATCSTRPRSRRRC